MINNKIHIGSGRPHHIFDMIHNDIRSRLDHPILTARRHGIKINLRDVRITDASTLAVEIARYRVEKEHRILHLVEKSINIANYAMGKNQDRDYSFHLDLSIFFPSLPIVSRDYDSKVRFTSTLNNNPDHFSRKGLFLKATSNDFAVKMLRQMDVLKRDYERPIDGISRSPFQYLRSDVNRLVSARLSSAIMDAVDAKVRLSFGAKQVKHPEDIAGDIYTAGLEKDGRFFKLLEKTLVLAAAVSKGNLGPSLAFSADLLMLTPDKLRINNVSNYVVEDIIDSRDYANMVVFLRHIHALEW